MQAGLVVLCLGYVLSQFFRAFLAILAPDLQQDLGASEDDLAQASGYWFLSFAAMQLPVGSALDRIGPRLTTSVLLLIGGAGGALLFAVATSPGHISAAMFLIGIGCSPVLMASYFIFAQQYPPARFATLAAAMLGIGSLGNLLATYPTALAAEWLGWRGSLIVLSVFSAVVATGIFLMVRDPEKQAVQGSASVIEILKIPALWTILPLMLVAYAPSAAIRGLWIGPYLQDVFGHSTVQIGTATLVMGVSMIAGTFAYGPLDQILRTRKWLIFGGNAVTVVLLVLLSVWDDVSPILAVALMAGIGFFGATFPVMIAHGRAFFPHHLMGRGVTLLNLFGIGGVGLMQFLTGRLHESVSGASPAAPYSAIFGFFAAAVLVGCVIYLFSRDSLD